MATNETTTTKTSGPIVSYTVQVGQETGALIYRSVQAGVCGPGASDEDVKTRDQVDEFLFRSGMRRMSEWRVVWTFSGPEIAADVEPVKVTQVAGKLVVR
jgi:hypothetical protein